MHRKTSLLAAKRVVALLIVIAAVATCGLIPGSAQADSDLGLSVWHRLNAAHTQPPEHERFGCLQGSLVWLCRYDKVPEPTLSFQWNSTTGYFVGRDLTSSWSCPAWFPPAACTNVVRVVGGTVWYLPAVGQPFNAPTDLIFTGLGTSQKLYQYWVNQHVCPWFPTFAQALAANPFPLPFNGADWPKQDCTFAP